MTHRFLSRLGGGVVALALGLTTVFVMGVGPAHADASMCTTTTTLTVNVSSGVAEYGDYGSIKGDVAVAGCTGGTATSGIGTGAGQVVIERDTGAGWQVIATGTYPDYVSVYGDGFYVASAQYRARYTGGTESTTYQPDTFAASESAPLSVGVIRAVDVKDRSKGGHIVGKFKITPATGLPKKVQFLVQKGKKWKKYKKAKVNKQGLIKTTFAGSSKGINYSMVLPAGAGFLAHTYGPYTATVHRY